MKYQIPHFNEKIHTINIRLRLAVAVLSDSDCTEDQALPDQIDVQCLLLKRRKYQNSYQRYGLRILRTTEWTTKNCLE